MFICHIYTSIAEARRMQRKDFHVTPVLLISPDHLSDSNERLGLFDCSLIVKPFEVIENCIGYDSRSESKSPIICLSCGAFLSLYSPLAEDSGHWRCSLCKSLNPSFVSWGRISTLDKKNGSHFNQLMEYRSTFCEYRENITTSLESLLPYEVQQRNRGFDCHIFAIDCCCIWFDEKSLIDPGGKWLLQLIHNACGQLSTQNAQVGFFLFRGDGSSSAVSVLRLSGSGKGLGSGSSVMEMDVFSGTDRTSHSRYEELIRAGVYTSLSTTVYKHFNSIRAAILTVAGASAYPRRGGSMRVSLSNLVSIAMRFSAPSHNKRGSLVRLSLICGGPLPLGDQLEDDEVSRMESGAESLHRYLSLGASAMRQNLSIDALLYFNSLGKRVCAADVGYADRLESLVCPSGGLVLTLPEALDDRAAADAVRLSFLESLSAGGAVLGDLSSPATLEIRTCGRLKVRKVTGPIAQDSYGKGSIPVVNPQHVAHTMATAEAVSRLEDRVISGEKSADDILRRLEDYNKKHTYSARLSTRFRAGTSIGVQLSQLRSQAATASSDGPHSSINRMGCAYIQVVVRFDVTGQPVEGSSGSGEAAAVSSFAVYRPVDEDDQRRGAGAATSTPLRPVRVVNYSRDTKSNTTGKNSTFSQRITRVWTHRIELTSDAKEFLDIVDERLLAAVLCRGVREASECL